MVKVPRKNIYVKDADAPVLQRFEEQGGNASQMFSDALASWAKSRERDMLSGFGRIELTVQWDEDEPPIKKAFVGRWLIEPRPEGKACYSNEPNVMAGSLYGIAETQKGNFVGVYTDRHLFDTFSGFDVVDNLDDLEDYPEDIVERAKAVRGEIEELDI